MKIQLEFETPDLQDMIYSYFSARGFHVKNMDALCEAFAVAFPEGLKVYAEVAAKSPEPDPVPTTGTNGKQPVILKNDDDVTGRMNATDLLDPEYNGKLPTREELIRNEEAEIARILERNKALAKERNV